MVEKRREVRIGASQDREDIIISVQLEEAPEPEKISYEIDAEKLFEVLWKGVPSGTVDRLLLRLVKAYEGAECKPQQWEDYKRAKHWTICPVCLREKGE